MAQYVAAWLTGLPSNQVSVCLKVMFNMQLESPSRTEQAQAVQCCHYMQQSGRSLFKNCCWKFGLKNIKTNTTFEMSKNVSDEQDLKNMFLFQSECKLTFTFRV